MPLTLERDDGDGPRRRELTDDELRLVGDTLGAAFTDHPSFRAEGDPRRMLLHWFRPPADAS